MEKAYAVIFGVGVVYTIVTFLLGGLLDIVHLGGHFDTHVDTHVHVDGHNNGHVDGGHGFAASIAFLLRPITMVSFLTVFGGVGMMGPNFGLGGIVLLVIALSTAVLVSYMLHKLIVVPLLKAQNTSAFSAATLIGTKATVISTILEDGYGVIAYVVNGKKFNAPAQHVVKKFVAQGEEVIIFEIKNNVYYVQPVNETTNK